MAAGEAAELMAVDPQPDACEGAGATGGISSIEEIVAEARAGRMFVLVDDENRENEGDLVIPASAVTPDAVNFMARYGRGLVCLSLSRARCEELGLPLASQGHESRLSTAFTHSIEARAGVTTGISAADRARTIQVAVDPACGRHDLATPGHVFPLMARDGGVLVRAGHTEAAVDIARLAGLPPAGVICEIMNDDGTMARLPDLVPFARRHRLKIGTIADLIQYRLRKDRLVRAIHRGPFESRHGGRFDLAVYRSEPDGVEHVALCKGAVEGPDPVLVRVHSLDILRDLLGGGSPRDELKDAMIEIAGAGRGVVLLLREPCAGGVTERLQQASAGRPADLRVYGIGAQILRDLGVRNMRLLSSTPMSVVGLDGYGLRVVETLPLDRPRGRPARAG